MKMNVVGEVENVTDIALAHPQYDDNGNLLDVIISPITSWRIWKTRDSEKETTSLFAQPVSPGFVVSDNEFINDQQMFALWDNDTERWRFAKGVAGSGIDDLVKEFQRLEQQRRAEQPFI